MPKPPKPPRRHTPKRVSEAELGEIVGMSVQNLRWRVQHGKLHPPGPDRRFDLATALEDFKRNPKRNTRPQRPAPSVPIAGRAGDPPSTDADAAVRADLDPDTRFRLAKARQEEIKLARLREESLDAALVERRVFALFRLVRGRLDAWVSRAAPALGAALGAVDEGTLWRALKAQVGKLQAELAGLDLGEALKQVEAEDAESEPEDDPPPKPGPGRPKKHGS